MILRRPGFPPNLIELRRELRRSFVYDLPSHRQVPLSFNKPGKFVLSDDAALYLLEALSIQFDNATSTARQRYEERRTDDDVSWSDLAARDWTRESSGRVWVTAAGLREVAEHPMPALAELHQTRFNEAYTVAAPARSRADLAEVAAALESGEAGPIDIGCQTPSWVSARLWDAVADSATQADLYQWLAKWQALGSPDVTPSKAWSDERAQRFVDLALETIETQLPANGWRLLRDELTVRQPSFASNVQPLPADPPRRLQWAKRLQVLDIPLDPDSATLTLVGILLDQVAIAEYVPVPYPVADRLFLLALERPKVMRRVADSCVRFPIGLADLVINPATCTLACSIIAEYPNYQRSIASFGRIDDTEGRERAFSDAVTVLTYFFETEQVSAQDVAALFVWLFRERDPKFAGRRDCAYRRLRHITDEQPPELVKALVSALQASDDGFSLETSAYGCALGIIAETSLDNVADTQQILQGYVDAIQRADYSLSVRYLSNEAAAVIVRLALALPGGPPVLGKPHVLFALREPHDPNPYTEESRLARAVRAHVRVLCRALCRLAEDNRRDAISALVRAIRYGARSNEHGGIVGAFAARHEEHFRSDGDRPIAEDLAEALGCTHGDDRTRLIGEIKQIDEPYTLAQLYARVALDLRSTLEERILQLGPDEAASVLSYTEIQLRTEALLSAGLTAAAQAYADAERELKTFGRVAQREQARFVNDLRLALLNKNWHSLYDARVPDNIEGFERQQALDNLAFFQGVAKLLDPAGKPEWAEQTFLQLSTRFPHVPAYAHNLLVARVRQLFGEDVFAILPEDRRDAARAALAEAGHALMALSATDAERDAINAYRGLIFLGLSAPDDAVTLLGPRVVFTGSLYLAAAVAVGQHRIGDEAAAMQTLAAARERLGDSDILRAAQAVVGNKPHIAVRPTPEQSDDRFRAIREAVHEFCQRDPEDQALILNSSLAEITTNVVRDASVSLVELAPSLREERVEADYNSALHKLVRTRATFFGWSVSEESPGGRTVKGTSGRRDIVISFGVASYAVIEGVVVNRPVTQEWTKDILRQHLAKIFSYGTCRVFFHITYAEIDEPAPIVQLLQTSAQVDVPSDFTYIGARDLPERGSSPPGFVAEYRDGARARTIYVVFLVLDIAQRRLTDAAAAGDGLNPRKNKRKRRDRSNEDVREDDIR